MRVVKLMIKKVYITIFFCSFVFFGQAQTPDLRGANIQYHKDFSTGFILHSDGWGVSLRKGVHKTGFRRHQFGLDFSVVKHAKQEKVFNPWYEDSRGYFYGKENSLILLRPYYGIRSSITDKLRDRAVEFGYIFAVGPTLGIVKPVYLEIGSPSVPYDQITTERYDPTKHYVDNIYGRAPVMKGLGESKIYPGASFKFGLIFEHSNSKDRIKTLEAGITLDAFLKEVPMMAFTENKQVFFAFYIGFFFGKKQVD